MEGIESFFETFYLTKNYLILKNDLFLNKNDHALLDIMGDRFFSVAGVRVRIFSGKL